MKIGDLVMKIGGYGAGQRWVGLIIEINFFLKHAINPRDRFTVMTDDGFECWRRAHIKKIV